MLQDKTGLIHLAELMIQQGIRYLIISPGSRNAPIITVFCQRTEIQCLTIVDERSAAFFALGMAQQLNAPVAIACTSGSAVLNYAPAIAEAFYQRIPLVVLTADRPVEWIDQGDGQTIRQENVFAPHIRKSVQLPQSFTSMDDVWFNDRLVSEALNAAVFPVAGPVQINLPFREPLYGFNHSLQLKPKLIQIAAHKINLTTDAAISLANRWNKAKRKMILVGQMPPEAKLQKHLEILAADPSVVVLTETTSNVFHPLFVGCIDGCLSAMEQKSDFEPELLLTFGGPVVSKRIKSFLRKSKIVEHWNVDVADYQIDTYQQLTHAIPMLPLEFLDELVPKIEHSESFYSEQWQKLSTKTKQLHQEFIANSCYSDLKIFETILQQLPEVVDLQLANSTPIRYAQLFEYNKPYRFDSNRGTSGIDGSVSTAAGAAFASGRPTILITGDLGFFYDSNALWNKHLPANLKIIMINNEGGGIFRFIEGPEQTGLMEEFFEAKHKTTAKDLVRSFQLDYFNAVDVETLNTILPQFFMPSDRASVLEINSPAETSAEILKQYFRMLAEK